MGQILEQRFHGEPWIFQTTEAVKEAVQRCYEQLRGSTVTQNGSSNGSYQYPARTREELLATQDQVPRVVVPKNVDQAEVPNGDQPKQRDNDGPVSWVL